MWVVRSLIRRLADRFATAVASRVVRILHERTDRSDAQYAALAVLRDRYPAFAGLTGSELRVFSQNGEDGMIAEIFARIGAPTRTFVEFGVGAGTECNTRLLAEVLGWSGVYFEPDPVAFPALAARYEHRPDVVTVNAAITPATVDEQFAAAGVAAEPDLCSIDVDGSDYWIWRALTRYRPRVVVIEVNAALPPDERWAQPEDAPPWDETDAFGASLGALRALGADKGYRLVHWDMTGVNACFVRDDLADAFPDAPVLRAPNQGLRGGRHPAGSRPFDAV